MRVSVIVANHNYGFLISKTITSLLSQSMPSTDYEVIVMDDCSNDISMNILLPFVDSIRLIKSDKQEGVLSICNEGFRRAKGQYIVRVDADDYVNKNFLEIEALFLEENKEFDAVGCDYYKVDERGHRLGRYNVLIEPIACGVMFRREVIFSAGLYNEEKIFWEDRNFVSRLNVYRIPLPLYRYLQHEGSLTHEVGV